MPISFERNVLTESFFLEPCFEFGGPGLGCAGLGCLGVGWAAGPGLGWAGLGLGWAGLGWRKLETLNQ